MQYKKNQKIIIDSRKLEVLIRLGCPDEIILQKIKTGKSQKTGDKLIDETLECLVDFKEFENWGGKRDGSGRPRKISIKNQASAVILTISKSHKTHLSLIYFNTMTNNILN